jgi:hypothetical protein
MTGWYPRQQQSRSFQANLTRVVRELLVRQPDDVGAHPVQKVLHREENDVGPSTANTSNWIA